MKTTPSSWVSLPICLEWTSWIFANLASPPSLEYRVFLCRRKFYGRREREWTPEAQYRTWNNHSYFAYFHSPAVPLFAPRRSKLTEPLPPLSPPPPFVPLGSTGMEDGIIGLLRPFCKSRFGALTRSQVTTPKPPPPTADGVTAVGDPSTTDTTASPLSNATATHCAATHTNPITNNTHPSRRCAKTGSNQDGTTGADCRWEIDVHCRTEGTEEREESHII